MMVSLFSVFDPISFLGVSLNWLIVVVVLALLPGMYYFSGGMGVSVMSEVESFLKSVYSEVSFPSFAGLIMVGFVLLVYVASLNVMGLFPYVFSSTGHVIVTLSIGLMMWMMSLMMGWVSMFKFSSAHLVPEGAPLVLAPFMVMIESVSHMIRPVTLSVRLAANMMAGHLIIGLIASISEVSFKMFWVSVFFQGVMLILEWAVCFIQAFVFSILVVLYALDYY